VDPAEALPDDPLGTRSIRLYFDLTCEFHCLHSLHHLPLHSKSANTVCLAACIGGSETNSTALSSSLRDQAFRQTLTLNITKPPTHTSYF
jgi:hypothetical protein